MCNDFLGDLLSGKIQSNKTILQRAHDLKLENVPMVSNDGHLSTTERTIPSFGFNPSPIIYGVLFSDCRLDHPSAQPGSYLLSRPNKEILTQAEQERLEQFFNQ